MKTQTDVFWGRDFWTEENLRYSQPHFRLEKCARIVNTLSRGKECDLLDVGCGPATLARLLRKNINYHGIDIAIHTPASNLIEADLVENEIAFKGKSFDIIVAAGFFEYLGDLQDCKLLEIAHILKQHGTFIASCHQFRPHPCIPLSSL
jgi:predicted TPR repeat methyltransferase